MNEIIELVKPEFVGEIKANIKGLGVIEHNISNAKEYAIAMRDYFSKVVYDEEQIRLAKEDRATINKLSTKIGDYRKDIVREFKKPIDDFETIAKETEKLFKETAGIIDTQVKAFEEKDWIEKAGQIQEIINIAGLDITPDFNPKWKNKTYDFEEIIKDIRLENVRIQEEETDLFTGERIISKTFTGTETQIDLLDKYAKFIGMED